MFLKLYISLMIFCFIFFGCETADYTVKKPENFAVYKKVNNVYSAISADGIKFKVYTVKNEPHGDTKMWMESVNIHLKGRGYRRIVYRNIAAVSGLKGLYSEYIYRYYGENYIYALTIFEKKENLYLIEIGGIDKYYKKKRESILMAIEGFNIVK